MRAGRMAANDNDSDEGKPFAPASDGGGGNKYSGVKNAGKAPKGHSGTPGFKKGAPKGRKKGY